MTDAESGEDTLQVENRDEPKFDLDQRIDRCLSTVSDLHTEFTYVRLSHVGVEDLRRKAEMLETHAKQLQDAIDRVEEESK